MLGICANLSLQIQPFFSSVRGIPRLAKTFWVISRCFAEGDVGGEMIRKSSKRWMRCGIL